LKNLLRNALRRFDDRPDLASALDHCQVMRDIHRQDAVEIEALYRQFGSASSDRKLAPPTSAGTNVFALFEHVDA
jgi:hypothetical protein